MLCRSVTEGCKIGTISWFSGQQAADFASKIQLAGFASAAFITIVSLARNGTS